MPLDYINLLGSNLTRHSLEGADTPYNPVLDYLKPCAPHKPSRYRFIAQYIAELCSRVRSRAITLEESSSYPEVTRKLLGRWLGLLLEIAIVVFGIGENHISLYSLISNPTRKPS